MMAALRIYPVFLPFSGCPSKCIYCDQSINTLKSSISTEKILDEVKNQVELFKGIILKNKNPGELAFYGGTFTSLPVSVLENIAKFLHPLFRQGIFTGVRCSTRPDALKKEAMEILKTLPVSMIELGVQTLNDHLLKMLRRGYTVETVVEAVEKVKSYGWKVGLQLMVGIPGENLEIFLENVKKAIGFYPDAIRLYPLVVFPNTVLGRWYSEGIFRPLSLKEAIIWCAKALLMFEDAGVKVIRMGLQSNRALDSKSFLAGPYHPSFGYFVRVHWWRLVIDRELSKLPATRGTEILLRVPRRFFDECRGPRWINVRFWMKKWALKELSMSCLDDKDFQNKRVYQIDCK